MAAAFVLPSRDSLSLGERIMAYLPRCADTDAEVRKAAIQVCAKEAGCIVFFCYSMFLPFCPCAVSILTCAMDCLKFSSCIEIKLIKLHMILFVVDHCTFLQHFIVTSEAEGIC